MKTHYTPLLGYPATGKMLLPDGVVFFGALRCFGGRGLLGTLPLSDLYGGVGCVRGCLRLLRCRIVCRSVGPALPGLLRPRRAGVTDAGGHGEAGDGNAGELSLAAGQAAHGITQEKDLQQIAGAQLGTAKRCSRTEEAANAVFIF